MSTKTELDGKIVVTGGHSSVHWCWRRTHYGWRKSKIVYTIVLISKEAAKALADKAMGRKLVKNKRDQAQNKLTTSQVAEKLSR